MRGNYFSGQLEWLQDNKLQDFTLDLNDLRAMAGGYKMLLNGFKSLNYTQLGEISGMLFELLELRMKRGQFCVVNAPNANNSLLKEYKDLCDAYRYKLFIIDFKSDLTLCKQRNLKHAKNSGVFIPEHILEALALSLSKEKVPKKYTLLSPDEWRKCLYQKADLNKYKKIHHFGDIQGCFSVLKKALGKIKKDEFYIFLGDYIDRGIENGKVIELLMRLKDLPNVILLEGNHERHLITWAQNKRSSSKEFNENTLKDFKKDKITKTLARALYPHFKECFYYEFDDKKVLCSHAGLSYMPSELAFVPSEEFINGVGGYEDSKAVGELFTQSAPADTFELFGHRNRQKLDMQIAARAFLLEGKVDAGGFLRVVTLSKKGFECKQIKNEVFKK